MNELAKLIVALDYLEVITEKEKRQILEITNDYDEFLQMIELKTKQVSNILTEIQIENILSGLQINTISKIQQQLDDKEIKVLSLFDNKYPKNLKEIQNPPLLLYCKGDINLLSSDIIGIVGARKNTSYGADATRKIVDGLVKENITIASGLADGIDYVSHSQTLKSGGKTVAVIAGGLDNIYPKENTQLANAIFQSGVVISEYKPSEKPKPFMFPKRNRIISGISFGTLIVEASKSSGALITVEHAINQGRRVYAIPNPITSLNGIGVNLLLKSGIAKIVIESGDIVQDIRSNDAICNCGVETMQLFREVVEQKKVIENQKTKIDKNENRIEEDKLQFVIEEQIDLEILDAIRKTDGHFDTIMQNVKCDVSKLNERLFMLELSGEIEKQAGNFYKI